MRSSSRREAAALPLVGRTDELRQLRDALRDAAQRRGTTIFVAGEGGVGKTRLVSELAAGAERDGWTVAIGRAYPVETGVPYAVFADALVPALRALDASALAILTRGGGAELATLFPPLADERQRSVPRGDPAEVKARVLWNFAQLLARWSAKRPLLLVLENLQWADSASLELLHFTARQIADARVTIVGTYNVRERDANEALRSTEASLTSLGVARAMRIEPLTREGTEELVRETLHADSRVAAPLAQKLFDWTRGNPFFLGEVLKALTESSDESSEWNAESLALPASIREALLTRLARLSPQARSVADLAAVIGARAKYDALRCVSDLGGDALLAALDELQRSHVIVESASDGAVVYDFAHPMVRDALYDELGLARARRLHARIATQLEAFYGKRAGAHAAELAFHYSRANAADLTPKAVRYLAIAGRAALELHANREAADYLETALELADRAGIATSDRAGTSLIDELARAKQRLGRHADADALWERARAEAEANDQPARVASIERRQGLACYWRGRHRDALEHLARGIELAERAKSAALAARLHIAAGVVELELGHPAEAERATQRALEIAARRGDAALEARAQRALTLLYLWTGAPEPARVHGARAIELARESEQLSVEWSAHWALAMLGGLTGNAEETERHLREAERLAEQLRSPAMRAWSAEIAIEVLSAKGEWDDALALAERTTELARSLGHRALLPRLLVWTGILRLFRGDMDGGRALVDEAWEISGAGRASSANARVDVHTVVPAHIGRATYHLVSGEYADAIHVGRVGLAIADRSGYLVWAIYRLLPVIAESALRNEDLETARWVGTRLRADSQRLGHALGLAWADACDALVATLGGDAARGVGVLREAATALEAIPFVPDAARLRRELGYRLATVGDRDGALHELRTAHDVFTRLGAARELATAREQIRELGARPPVRPSGPGAEGLTAREIEIARLVAARKSNKEIGRALDISARTVSTHLSNIFAKLGIDSRGELADFARERL